MGSCGIGEITIVLLLGSLIYVNSSFTLSLFVSYDYIFLFLSYELDYKFSNLFYSLFL